MNALLVYPEFPTTFWSMKHALRLAGKRATAPPLGLATVAAMLPETWTLRLVDENIEHLRDDDLAWADAVLVSAMVIQRESARTVIERAKAAGCTTVAGGPLFTTESDAFDDVDHLVLNEAEVTLPLFLRDLANGCPEHVYTSSELADIRSSPVPRWDLVHRTAYTNRSIQYSRGCPHNCDFCSVTQLFGHRWRTKTPQQIIAELDAVYERGWRGSVNFVDDNLAGRPRVLREELLPALIEWRRGKEPISFGTQIGIEIADDPELMDLMVHAGFDSVFIGIESVDEASLTECNKRQNRDRDLLADVRRIQQAGLLVTGGFIVGFDHDEPTVFDRLVDFIQRSGITTAMVGVLQAPEGTKLFERLEKQGRITGAMSGDNVNGLTNVVTRMDADTLRSGYRRMLRKLYATDSYYARIRTFIRNYRPPRRRPPRLRGWHIRAYFLALFELGFARRDGWRYHGLLWWTLFRKPRAFPTAITLAIAGYHFGRLAETLPE
jgi:radical SAM superfamily enzyme YgiQ (UPF0313 family)